MTTYHLYLESGPRQKTTMVHVLDLLGCIAQGKTTPEALENTPASIRRFLAFLQHHGEPLDPNTSFEVQVVQHIMDGPWIGYGDPAPGFQPDFNPLTSAELTLHLRHLTWIHQEILELVRDLTPTQLNAQPEIGGRPVGCILDHLAEAESAYIRYQVGKVEGLAAPLKILQQDPAYAVPALQDFWAIIEKRIATFSEVELQAVIPHGQVTWTAHRCLRRLLEHSWEHWVEISNRLKTD